jgi:hypothetical protein
MSNDDYLWDGTGEPDPEVARLEQSLRGYRYEGGPPALPARRRRWILVAAAALVAVGLAIALRGHEPAETPPAGPTFAYEAEPLAGGAGARGELAVGGWLETKPGERARVHVAEIGTVTLAEESRLGLVATGEDQHRMRLERGALHAIVNAPPRLFIIETPTIEAVDLGCEYTLEVDEGGDGQLAVTRGWVALERDGSSVVVPYDAVCDFHRARGAGTPYFRDAPDPLRQSLQAFDRGERDPALLQAVAEAARPRDTLTLFHLLPRVAGKEREGLYDRMAALADAPSDVTREGTLALDPAMLESWLETLRYDAW